MTDGSFPARVYFGHQSVGGNILSGVGALDPSRKIIQVSSANDLNGPAIYHSKIGKNRDVASKIAAFEEMLVDKGLGQSVDVALMKFCYVDITPDTDVEKLFADYTAAVARIQARFPKLKLIHATCPVTVHGGGLKKTIKNWIKGDLVNAARAKYNALVRERYRKSPGFFDIAAVESTRPDGSRETFRHRGQICEGAAPEFTDGSGHLNPTGAKRLAQNFLKALAAA